MVTKNTAAGFEFLLASLKANKGAQYSDLKPQAEAKGLTVYPVMFGRAKAMLGLVKSAKRGRGKAAKATKAAKASAKPTGKRRPGRPKGGSESKSGQIRELLKTGMTAAEIAKKVGCTAALVYNVKSTSGKSTRRAAMRRAPGRPRKVSSEGANGSVESVLEALRENQREHERMARAMEKIRAVLAEIPTFASASCTRASPIDRSESTPVFCATMATRPRGVA